MKIVRELIAGIQIGVGVILCVVSYWLLGLVIDGSAADLYVEVLFLAATVFYGGLVCFLQGWKP
jgi:VIT1/CCC1 family predicted Fe2+/Mn2+ transporter